jgi:uncharacterized protein (DUF1697 family)
METFIALLRAVNVGGTGKLPMSELRLLCERVGFSNVRTYIASGNVIFTSDKSQPAVKKLLETSLAKLAGKPVGVVIRTARELAHVLETNPFAKVAPDRAVVIFLDEHLQSLGKVVGQKNESIELAEREIYVFYPDGIGQSKLKIANAKEGTARNVNTVSKLVQMAVL